MPLGFFGNASGSYASAVPFQRIVEPAQLGFFLNLEQAELLRIQRYGEHQRFYLGKHWNFKRDDGEPLATTNYFRKLIDKSVEWLMGAGFETNVPQPLIEVTGPFLREVWEYNGAEQLAWDVGVMGAVTGDVFLLVTYEEPSQMQRRINPFSQGKIRINLLGSEQVFPTWDPLNTDTLIAVRIETIFYAERGTHQLDQDDKKNHQGRTLYTKRFTQIITCDQIVEQFHGDQPVVRPNVLGEIPLVHIKNIPMPKEYYGLPDGLDIIDLQRRYNETNTDMVDAINYAGHPIIAVFGSKAKNLERNVRAIWGGFPPEARIEQLPPMADLPANLNYLAQLKKEMCELADVPEGSLGEMQPISNTSAAALAMMYQPLKAKTDRKRVQYKAGIEQVNYFVLRVAQITGLLGLPYDVCSECGGRIVETETGEWGMVWAPDPANPSGGQYVMQPVRKKKCYLVDPQTLDFMHPEEVRLKFVRKYGFGTEVREAPYWTIEREVRLGKPSFWDYSRDDLLNQQAHQQAVHEHGQAEYQRAQENAQQDPEMDATGNPLPKEFSPIAPPAPPPQVVPTLPAQFIDVPEEPENVNVVIQYRHPATGDVQYEQRVAAFLVPTGCKVPKYLNPYKTEVEFHDVLPKDKTLTAQLMMLYQQMGLVDVEWCQDQVPEIRKDKKDLQKRMKNAGQAGPQNPAGGFQDSEQQQQPNAQPQGGTYTEAAPPEQHPNQTQDQNYGGRPAGT